MHERPIAADIPNRRHPVAAEQLFEPLPVRQDVEFPIEERDPFALGFELPGAPEREQAFRAAAVAEVDLLMPGDRSG